MIELNNGLPPYLYASILCDDHFLDYPKIKHQINEKPEESEKMCDIKEKMIKKIDTIIEKMPPEATENPLTGKNFEESSDSYLNFFNDVKNSIKRLQDKNILDIVFSTLRLLPCIRESHNKWLYILYNERESESESFQILYSNEFCNLYLITDTTFCEFLKQASELENILKEIETFKDKKIEFLNKFRKYGYYLWFYLQAAYEFKDVPHYKNKINKVANDFRWELSSFVHENKISLDSMCDRLDENDEIDAAATDDFNKIFNM